MLKVTKMVTKGIKISKMEQTYFKLLSQGKHVFGIDDIKKLGYKYGYAKKLASGLHKKGLVKKVKKGKYCLSKPQRIGLAESYADPYLVAAQIFGRKSYFAYLSAWDLYGKLTQVPFVIYVVTEKQYRPIEIENLKIIPIKIISRKIFGLKEINYKDTLIKITEIEKTIVDSFEKPHLVGGVEQLIELLDDLVIDYKLNFDKLLRYLKRIKSHSAAHRLGYVFAVHRRDWGSPDSFLKKVEKLIQKGRYYLLDPKGSKRGKKIKKWAIIINTKEGNGSDK